LEGNELPGPDAILFLETWLGGIGRDPDDHEVTDRTALVAAIYELGGNGRVAAGIWRKPDYDLLQGYGRTRHRHRDQVDRPQAASVARFCEEEGREEKGRGLEAIDHVDLVVSSLERRVPFYEGLLRPPGYVEAGEILREEGDLVVGVAELEARLAGLE
jgi:hypothetical protein